MACKFVIPYCSAHSKKMKISTDGVGRIRAPQESFPGAGMGKEEDSHGGVVKKAPEEWISLLI